MKEKFKLKDLLIDKDYQKEFTYEERVDIFNKYGYSTSMLFFTPIYHFTTLIMKYMGYNINQSYGYGHGKTILDKTMFEKALNANPLERKILYKIIKENKEYLRFPFSDFAIKGTIQYWLENEDLTIKINDMSCKVPKINIYEKIEEWLIDFKYK